MKILVTGGAGYIGSHACKALARAGMSPVCFDNLSQGHRWAVRWGPLEVGELADTLRLIDVMRNHQIELVMHFAAMALVGESMSEPERYYQNNLAGSLSLLRAMRSAGVKRLVFSSTCAVYGMPRGENLGEDHPREPVNVYGHTKLMMEQMIADFTRAYQWRSVSLRYFNAAGCDEEGETGEVHDPETHLIPCALEVASGKRSAFTLHGDSHPTPDGTCVRDFVHVEDLADAHRRAALALMADQELQPAYNLGTGQGYSVREVVEGVRQVTGHPLPIVVGPPRPGDPPRLVAQPGRVAQDLGWTAQGSDLPRIIRTAWAWEQARSGMAGNGCRPEKEQPL